MYASRDIRAGEELLIDYCFSKPLYADGEGGAGAAGAHAEVGDRSVGDRSPTGHMLIRCLCGSDNCRGFLWV